MPAAALVKQDATIRAFSSHQIRFPFHPDEDVQFTPVVLLQHPILRAASVYDFERTEARQAQSSSPHTAKAAELDFADYVEWCLSMPNGRPPISNFQTRVCSLTANGHDRSDWGSLRHMSTSQRL